MNWYSVYKNINKQDFEKIKSRLELIERVCSPFMQMNGFYLNQVAYDEGLDLDYLSKDDKFKGNIGVAYDEENSTNEENLFKFYILKTYDTLAHRFYKKDGLKELYSLEEVEKKIITLFAKCLDIYKALQHEDLNEKVELKR